MTLSYLDWLVIALYFAVNLGIDAKKSTASSTRR